MINQTNAQVLKRKEELTSRMAAIRAELAGGLERDSEEQALQLENMEVLQEIYRLATIELQELERKLAVADHPD